MFTLNGQLGQIFFSAVILLAVVAAPVQSVVAAPAEWRQLSRLQVNPPGIQAFVETAFSYNQLKAVPGGDLFLGFTAVRDANPNKDTDVYVSRYVRSEDRWGSPAAIAESPALERSPAVWVDGRSGVIHFSWVGNERRKQRKQRSELRVGYRRSEDGGTSWTPPRQFARGDGPGPAPPFDGRRTGQLESGRFQWLPRGTGTHPSVSEQRRRERTGARWTSMSRRTGSEGERHHPGWPLDRASGHAWSGLTGRPDGERSSSADPKEISPGPYPSVSTTIPP